MRRAWIPAAAATAAAFIVVLWACTKAESKPAPPETTAAAPAPVAPVARAEPGSAPAVEPPAAAPAGGGNQPAGPDTSFKLEVTSPPPGAAAKELVARVKVVPGAGYHMNKEYPTKLEVQPPEGVTVAKPVQRIEDAAAFDNNQLAFDVKLTAAKPGTYKVPGTFKFAVCTDSTCDPKKQTIAIELTAK